MDDRERRYLRRARVGRLATADGEGRPNAVPVCFALLPDGDRGERIVSAVDEKPQSVDPDRLRRVRDVRENPRVALVVDHYREDWDRLGWVQVRGTARVLSPGDGSEGHDRERTPHASAVAALGERYDQYADHDLRERPVIAIEPGTVRSWGDLDPELAE